MTISRTERDFILRGLSDVQLGLRATHGMQVQEEGVEPFTLDNAAEVALLELVQQLLGAGPDVPEQLSRQFGMRAAIEARGDAKALELFEAWRAAARA